MQKTFLHIITFIALLSGFVLGQQPLDYDLQVDIKNVESFYVNDGSIFKYDIYYHNNGSQSIDNATISTYSLNTIPLLNLINTSIPWNTLTRTIHGLQDDVCLPDLYNNTGYYMEALDQWAIMTSDGTFENFSALLENFLVYGEAWDELIDRDPEELAYILANPGLFVLEWIIAEQWISLHDRFDSVGILDMGIIDPSCGTTQTIWSDLYLGTLAPNFGGYISVYAQLQTNTSSTIAYKWTSSNNTIVASAENINKNNGAIYRTFTNTADGTASLFFNKSWWPLLFNNQTILDSVIDDSMTEQEKAIALWQFVKDYTFNFPGLADDDNPWYRERRWMNEADERDPVQGLNTLYGMCGEINWVFASLVHMAWLQARRTEFSGHIATEVLIDNQDGNGPQRAFMDADGWAYWTDGSGRIYSVAELEQNPSIMYDNLGEYPSSYADVIASSGDNWSSNDTWSNSDHTMLLTLHADDAISYGYYQDRFSDDIDDVLYAEWTVTRAVLHDSMLSWISSNEFNFVEHIPYLPISFELSVDTPLEDDVYVYLKEQYTDSEVSLWRLHNRLVYNLNETPHTWEYAHKQNYIYTLRFVCPSGCDVEDLSSRIQLETAFTFNHLALPHDSDLDMIFSWWSSPIDAYIEHNTNQKIMFWASITWDQVDKILWNNTQTVWFNTLNHNYAILPISGWLLADVLAYKWYIYGSGLSLFEEEAFVGNVWLDLHNTLTIYDNIIMTDENEIIQVFLHSGVSITPSGNACGNEFLLAPQDITDLSGSTSAMTFVVWSACSGRTLSFSEPVRMRVALANNIWDNILAQVSSDGQNRSDINATRIDDNTIELTTPHFSTFQILLNSSDEENNWGWNGGWLSQDICPDEDLSGSYYDGECGESTSTSWALVHSIDTIMINDTCSISDKIMDAYKAAFDLGITTVADPCAADLYGPLLRKHLAKFLTMYAVAVLDMKPDMTRLCTFSDMTSQSAEMQLFAKTACQLWLMGLKQDGSPDTVFNPDKIVTRAQFGTTFSRLIYGNIHNIDISSPQHWYQNHLTALFDNNIMNDISKPAMQELRWFVLLMMSRAKNLME